MISATGTFEHSIDAKGRLLVASKLREELGSIFYLTLGIDECLSIYPMESWDRFTEKFTSLPISKSGLMRPLFANAVKCEPDAQGRITIPQMLRRYAGLEKKVVLIGVHNRVEIWDAEKWYASQEEMTPAKMKELLESLDA